MKKQWKGSLFLLLAAMIWGAAFVAQSKGMEYVGPFTLQASRFFLSGTVLLPFVLLTKPPVIAREILFSKKQTALYGICCGILLCIACTLQQFGLLYTSVSKSGFITALYIILVPVAGIFMKKKVSLNVWLGVLIALCGLYFLCLGGSVRLNFGDVLTFFCSIFFSAQILLIDRIGSRIRGVTLSCIQSYTVAAISFVCMFLFEHPTWDAIVACWLPITYAGILSGSVAYTLQIIGQNHSDPTIASLLMSLEAVFATLFGWLLLRQELAPRELLGCALMLCAILLAQIPIHKLRKKSDI